jgi:DNA-binding GntR family transcriptional regulator
MIEQLERLHRRIEITARAGETAEWRDLDWSFHELVCTFSRNTFLLASWRSISNLVRIYLHQHPSYVTNIGSILANHASFMAAIRSKDPNRAEAVFRTTILKTGFARIDMDVPPPLAVYVDPKVAVEFTPPASAGKSMKGARKPRRGKGNG